MLLPISFDILSTGTTGLTEQTYHNPPFFCKAKQLARSDEEEKDRKSTRLNSSHSGESRMPSSA